MVAGRYHDAGCWSKARATGREFVRRSSAAGHCWSNSDGHSKPRTRHNAINQSMWIRLTDLFNEFQRDESVRVIVLRGAGERAFSAGADISEFSEAGATHSRRVGTTLWSPAPWTPRTTCPSR